MTKEELEKRVHEFVVQVYKEGFEEGREDAEMDTKTRVEGAYAKGLEDAWECAKKVVLPSYEGGMEYGVFTEIFGECGYQRVLKKYNASEAMQKIKEYEERQKIAEYEYKQKKERCKTCEYYEGYSCYDCIKGIKDCFEPKQTDATDMNDESIKVGDEVEFCDSFYGSRYVVVRIRDDGTFEALCEYGTDDGLDLKKFHKTGRQFPQIAEVLKLLRGEE